ncbi:MAG TPA: hypothetical protein VFS78_10940 [Vicinamibacteria bacterium]|nr:hypothetical protein [Vicinamibacteria bacterium]
MTFLLVLALAAADPLPTADARASTLRAQAREALGGESALASVHGLSLQGHFHRLPPPDSGAGDTARPSRGPFGRDAAGDLDVDVALPDKMRREESISVAGGPSFTMIMGLSGAHAWMGTEGAAGGRGFGGGRGGGPRGEADARSPADRKAMEEERRAAMGRRLQGELARLQLALLADPGDGASVTYAGPAESPDGRADVLDVTSASGTRARLFLDATTHAPLMVTYQETMPARRFRRPMPADGVDRPETPAPVASPSDAAPRTVEVTLFLSDRRAVDGLQLPYHVSRAVNGNVVEEWDVTRWRVNPAFKPERFEKQ